MNSTQAATTNHTSVVAPCWCPSIYLAIAKQHASPNQRVGEPILAQSIPEERRFVRIWYDDRSTAERSNDRLRTVRGTALGVWHHGNPFRSLAEAITNMEDEIRAD